MSTIDKIVETLQEEIAALKARAAVDDDDVAHLRELKSISFGLWYDPDNDACERYGRKMEPHIAALCKKFAVK